MVSCRIGTRSCFLCRTANLSLRKLAPRIEGRSLYDTCQYEASLPAAGDPIAVYSRQQTVRTANCALCLLSRTVQCRILYHTTRHDCMVAYRIKPYLFYGGEAPLAAAGGPEQNQRPLQVLPIKIVNVPVPSRGKCSSSGSAA